MPISKARQRKFLPHQPYRDSQKIRVLQIAAQLIERVLAGGRAFAPPEQTVGDLFAIVRIYGG